MSQPYTVMLIEFIAEHVDHREEICTFSYTNRKGEYHTYELSINALKRVLTASNRNLCVLLDGTRAYRSLIPHEDSFLLGEIHISPRIYRQVMNHIPRERARISSLVHWKALPPASVSVLASSR